MAMVAPSHRKPVWAAGVALLGGAGFGLVALGCGGPQELRLSVDGGRKVLVQDVQKITITIPGVLEENASITQDLVWELTFSKPGERTQAVTLECQKANITGKSLGRAYDAELMKEALSKLRLDTVLDFRGRTLSYAEADLTQGEKRVYAAASAAVAEAKMLSPLGIIFPSEPLKPGVAWTIELDISPATSFLAGAEGKPEGVNTYRFKHIRTEAMKGRQAALIEYTQDSAFKALIPIADIPTWVESKTKSSGRIWVDRRTGLPLRRTYQGESSVDLGTGVMSHKITGEQTILSSPE
jgi:hypothetical protein